MTEREPTSERDTGRFGVVPALLLVALAGWLAAYLVRAYYDASGQPGPAWVVHAQSLALLFAGLILFLVLLIGERHPHEREHEAKTEPEAWLCPHCLRPYVPGAHVCPRCAAPQTFFAGTAGYERIYARMWVLGKAAHHPSRPIHLVGLVLIALPALVGSGLWMLFWKEGADGSLEVIGDILVLSILAVHAWAYGGLLYLGLRNCVRRARGVEPATPEIEYGSPPWWTYDVQWALPEVIEGGEDEGGPPPLPARPPPEAG